MSWDTVYWVSQLLLVILAGVALISGAVVNKRQSRQLLTLQTDLEEERHKTEEQREKTAKAERSLYELRKMVLEPRQITPEARAKAIDILQKGVKGNATISIGEINSVEARFFAHDLDDLLKSGGWQIKETKRKWQGAAMFPGTTLKFGKGEKVNFGKVVFPEYDATLISAFDVLGFEAGKFMWQEGGIRDLEDNTVEIIVGPKH
jgi:hypothetical protein